MSSGICRTPFTVGSGSTTAFSPLGSSMLCGTNRSCALAAVVPSRTGRGSADAADAVDLVGPATTGTDEDLAGAAVAVGGDCAEIADAVVASGMAVVEHADASHSRTS